jgi:methylmalonyl-CoA mutase
MDKNLFQTFHKVSSKEWKQKIQADLKGADYQTLITKTLENIDIKPFYHYDDYLTSDQFAPQSFKISQDIHIHNEKIANKIAGNALKNGAENIRFYFKKPFDIDTLLSGLPTEKLSFSADLLDSEFLIELYHKTNGQSSILVDPIGHFAKYGNWYENEQKDFEKLSYLKSVFNKDFPFININSHYYKNAGANIIQEITYSLSHAVEYIEKLGVNTISQINFSMATGYHYFFEIAKLKAFQNLWSAITNHYGHHSTAEIYSRPMLRNKTIFDPYVNLLRTGMESMAAVLGGSQTVSNLPFDFVFKKSNTFSERLARNQLIILKKEAYFNKALDSTNGDYFIEENTQKITQEALDLFKNIEASGGFLAKLYQGKIQQKIKETADKEQAAFDEGNLVLVGTNKYVNNSETLPEIEVYPFMKKRSGKTLIEPVIPKRLSEKIEQKRLKELGISF